MYASYFLTITYAGTKKKRLRVLEKRVFSALKTNGKTGKYIKKYIFTILRSNFCLSGPARDKFLIEDYHRIVCAYNNSE